MTIVKGTKQWPVKVTEERPLKRFMIIVLSLGFAVACVYASFFIGRAEGVAAQECDPTEIDRLQNLLSESKKSILELEQRVENIGLGAEVDRKASEEVRQEVIALKESIAVLEEENSFYRGLMAPTENKRGLTFGNVELTQGVRPRSYNFKVVMQQLATNHRLLKGTIKYVVVGRQNGLEARYELQELSEDITSPVIKLRFKYFQTIEGELSLPEGFEPKAIELVAKSTGKNPVTVEKRFGWLVEEVL